MAKNQEKKDKKERFNSIKQVIEVIKLTNELNPKFKLFASLAAIIPLIVFVIASILTGLYAVFIPLAILAGVVGFLLTLSRMAQSAGYKRVDGQPGASGAVLGQMRLPSIVFEEDPIAMDRKTYDLIFRGVGRSGIIFVTEDPNHRVKKLLDKEIARTKRVLPNVPINVINCGNDSNQVPLSKLRKAVKPKFTLSKVEVTKIKSRLRALGGMQIPIPKGMDPMKTPKGMGRRALRGK